MPLKNPTRVNWEAVRRISQIVQEDLEKSGFNHSNEYHCVFELWENELRKCTLQSTRAYPQQNYKDLELELEKEKTVSSLISKEKEKKDEDEEECETNGAKESNTTIKNNKKMEATIQNGILRNSGNNENCNGTNNIIIEEKNNNNGTVIEWYDKVAEYWDNEESCPADISGVLGGYGYVSPIDIKGSNDFLCQLYEEYPLAMRNKALDCGAGIGRVAKHLLSRYYDSIDLLEQSSRLLNKAEIYLNENEKSKVGSKFCLGVQDFIPSPNTYDVIWIQWLMPHLIDSDLVAFLLRCRTSLTEHGFICIKENILENAVGFDIDKEDYSVTRSDAYFKSLFRLGNLRVVKESIQEGFPHELYTVKSYALMR